MEYYNSGGDWTLCIKFKGLLDIGHVFLQKKPKGLPLKILELSIKIKRFIQYLLFTNKRTAYVMLFLELYPCFLMEN